jgi:hypothetical protein
MKVIVKWPTLRTLRRHARVAFEAWLIRHTFLFNVVTRTQETLRRWRTFELKPMSAEWMTHRDRGGVQ